MFSQIAHLLIQTAFGLLVYTLLLRFYMQALRDVSQPGGQLVNRPSPLDRAPGTACHSRSHGIDLATFLLAWLAQAFMLTLLLWVRGANLASAPGSRRACSSDWRRSACCRLALPADRRGAYSGLVQLVQSQVRSHRSWTPPPFYTIFRRFILRSQCGSLAALRAGLAQIALILLDNLAPWSRGWCSAGLIPLSLVDELSADQRVTHPAGSS